jgi:hypothetical protein
MPAKVHFPPSVLLFMVATSLSFQEIPMMPQQSLIPNLMIRIVNFFASSYAAVLPAAIMALWNN